ncbi:MAG: hypothetical protein IT305_18955 [Chloroflexi bacterium]|nr:hypothetical protein [Chloroflexota bacterium]
MVIRGLLLIGALYTVSIATILLLMKLPEIALLRYVVFATPALVSFAVVIEWCEMTFRQVAPMPQQDATRRVDSTPHHRAA